MPKDLLGIGGHDEMHATEVTTPRSIYVDTIASVSDPLSSMSSTISLVSLLSLVYQVRTPMSRIQGRLLTLLQTILPNAIPLHDDTPQDLEGYSHEEVLNSFIQFLNPVLNGMAGMIDFLAAVDGFTRPEEFRDFWSFKDTNLIKEFIQTGGPFRAMKGCDVPFLKVFVKDSSRRIALGRDHGLLMLVPGDARVGDGVWVDDGQHRLGVFSTEESRETYSKDGSCETRLEVPSTLLPLTPDGFMSG